MSENQTNIQEMEVIKDNVQITITFNSFLHHRLNRLLTGALNFKDMEEFGKVVDAIKKGDTSTHNLAYHTETILLLMGAIEESAQANGHTRLAKIDITTGKEIQ